VSRDSPYSHERWASSQGLTFPLLTDWTGEVVRAFGVAQTVEGLVDTPVRSCFLIDQEATIRGAWRYEDSEVPDIDALLEAAAALGLSPGSSREPASSD
jgi:peroxiredoxin